MAGTSTSVARSKQPGNGPASFGYGKYRRKACQQYLAKTRVGDACDDDRLYFYPSPGWAQPAAARGPLLNDARKLESIHVRGLVGILFSDYPLASSLIEASSQGEKPAGTSHHRSLPF